MATCVPSLSEQGWVTDPTKILNSVMSHYILTEYSQSLVFKTNLYSLPYTYHKHINDSEEMKYAVIRDLTGLLDRYFPQVEVDCSVVEITPSHHGLALYVAAMTENNEHVTLSKAIDISSEGLKKIINYSNYGDAKSHLLSLT